MATSVSERSKKLSRLFAFLIVVGMIAMVFGYFGPIIHRSETTFDAGSNVSKLVNEDKEIRKKGAEEIAETGTTNKTGFKGVGALKFFSTAVFVLGIVTVVWFVLLCVLYIENPELIYLVIGGLTVLASILSFIFVLIVLSSYRKYYGTLPGVEDVSSLYGLGFGAICLPVGGLLLGCGTAGMALTTPKVEVLHKG